MTGRGRTHRPVLEEMSTAYSRWGGRRCSRNRGVRRRRRANSLRALIRGGCVAVTAAALVVSMAGVATAAAKPKKQSAAKYAKTVCGTYPQLENDIGTLATAIGNLDPSDLAGYK